MTSSRMQVLWLGAMAVALVAVYWLFGRSGPTTPAVGERVEVTPIVDLELEPAVSAEVVGFNDVLVTATEIARGVVPVTGALNPITGQVWIGEQGGAIRVLSADGLSDPVLDLTDRTEARGERGLLGMAFGPGRDTLYVHYSDDSGDTRVVAFDLVGGLPVGGERVVLRVDQPQRNHNGGDIVFGPDGLLYVALGDGGGAGDKSGHAQNRNNLLGAILRIDPEAADPYAVPSSNPFASNTDGSRPEIWAYGVRNPFRVSFDTDGSLWVADVGQGRFEEITRIPPGLDGANLGWNLFEGEARFDGNRNDPVPDDYLAPTHVYDQSGEACSVMGGLVYRGGDIAGLGGAYIYSDFCEPRLWGFPIEEPGAVRDLGIGFGSGPTAFVTDADGEVIVLTQGGAIFRLGAG